MLPKSALQTIAACMVYDSELPKPSKLQLVRFIESASENQLKHYIVHGDIVKEHDVIVSEVAWLVPAAIIAAASAAGNAIYNMQFSKAAKACQNMKAADKQNCIRRYKINGISGKISALKREMGKCNQTSRPDKCRKMFDTYIKNAEKKMRKIQAP